MSAGLAEQRPDVRPSRCPSRSTSSPDTGEAGSLRSDVILRLLFAALLLALPQRRADGPGIALSDDARLHVLFRERGSAINSLAGQGFQIKAPNGSGPSRPSIRQISCLHIRPGLKVAESGTQVTLEGSANIDYVDYTGWLAPTHDLSYLGAGVNGALTLGKTGPVGFGLTENFSRSDHTTNPSLGIGSITNSNDLGARLAFRPAAAPSRAASPTTSASRPTAERERASSAAPPIPPCTGSDRQLRSHRPTASTLDARWKLLSSRRRWCFDSSIELRGELQRRGRQPFRPSRSWSSAGCAGCSIIEKVRAVVEGRLREHLRRQQRAACIAAGADCGSFSGPIAQARGGLGSDRRDGQRDPWRRWWTVQPVSGTYGL